VGVPDKLEMMGCPALKMTSCHFQGFHFAIGKMKAKAMVTPSSMMGGLCFYK
jgi:hypothetical protein